jgi:hypothetical protein
VLLAWSVLHEHFSLIPPPKLDRLYTQYILNHFLLPMIAICIKP